MIVPIQSIAPFGTVVKLNNDCVGHGESVVSVYVIGIFFQLQPAVIGVFGSPIGFYHRAVAVIHIGSFNGLRQLFACGGKGYAVHISRLQLHEHVQLQRLHPGTYRRRQFQIIGSAGAVPDKGGEIDFGGVYIHRGTVGERISAAPDHFVASFVIAAFRVGHVEINVQSAAQLKAAGIERVYGKYAYRRVAVAGFGGLSGRNVEYVLLVFIVHRAAGRQIGHVEPTGIFVDHFVGHFDGYRNVFQHEPSVEIVIGIPIPGIIEVSGIVYRGGGDVSVVAYERVAVVPLQFDVVGDGVHPRDQRLGVVAGKVTERAQQRRAQRSRVARIIGIRGYIDAGRLQDIEYRNGFAAQHIRIGSGVVRAEVLRIQKVISFSVGIEIYQFCRQGVGIGFQSVHGISVQTAFAGNIEGFENPRQNLYFQSYHLPVEHGIDVGVAAGSGIGAVVDIEFGISGVGTAVVIEMPFESRNFRGSFFFRFLSVDLCEVKLHGVLTEVPIHERFAQSVAFQGADFVGIIRPEHQVNVRIHVNGIGNGNFLGNAVGSHHVDVFVGVDFPVQYLYAHVFAVSRHHSVADNDVNNVNTAVYRDVVPIGRSEGIFAVIACRYLIGEHFVVDIQVFERLGLQQPQTFVGSFGTELPPYSGVIGGIEVPAGKDVGVQQLGKVDRIRRGLGIDVSGNIHLRRVDARFVICSRAGDFVISVALRRFVRAVGHVKLRAVQNSFAVFVYFRKLQVISRGHRVEVPGLSVIFYRQRIDPGISNRFYRLFGVGIRLRFVGDHQGAVFDAEVGFAKFFYIAYVHGQTVLARHGFVQPVLDDVIIFSGVIQHRGVFPPYLVNDVRRHHTGFGFYQVPTGQSYAEIVSEIHQSGVAVDFVIIIGVGIQFVPHPVVAKVRTESYYVQIVLQIEYRLITVGTVDGIIVSRIAVVSGVQIENRGIIAADTRAAVVCVRRIGHRFQGLPFVQILTVVAYQLEVVDRQPPCVRQNFDVIIPADAHKQVFGGGHIILLFVDYGDAVLVVKEEHILYRDVGPEIEYDGNGFVQFDGVHGIALQVLQVADGIHREGRFQFVDIENALFKTDLSGNRSYQFVHAEEVLYSLVRGSQPDDVGFERRPRIFHQSSDDIRQSQDDVVVLLRFEIVAHIGIESPYEVVLAHFKSRQRIIPAVLADIPVQAIVLYPHIPQFFHGVGGIQADVVGVNVRQRRDRVLHHHIQVQRERAARAPGPPAVVQKLFAYVLVVIQSEIDIGGVGEYERSIQPRFVAHKRTQQHRKIDFFRRREQELTFQVSGISHDVLEFFEPFEAGEHYFYLFADVLGIQVHSEDLKGSGFGYFLVGHFGGGIHFQLN